MASQIHIDGYLVNDKGTWTVRARFADTVGGKQRLHSKSTGFKVEGHKKRKDEAVMREIIEQWERAASGCSVMDDRITFGECIDQWMGTKKATVVPGTYESYKVHIRRHIKPKLGGIRLKDLTRQDIQGYFNSLGGVLSPNTMRKHMVIIKGALDNAVLNGVLLRDAGNVLTKIELPKKRKFEGKCLSEDEIKTVFRELRNTKEPIVAAVILGLCYGLRRSEICGLRWQDIDFEQGIVYIRNTVTDYNGERVERECTKTLASRRNIPMIEYTVTYLKDLYERRITQGMVSDKVCAHENGREAYPNYVTDNVEAFLVKCGIEGARLHDLRHTAASVLVKRMPVIYVTAFLGHNQVSTTLNIYSHLLDSEGAKASQEMNAFLGNTLFCSESCSETALNDG